ncbi:hypothetical protein BE17_19710 [Sorangium cellulosum]|uniref:Uncharacterized protein n=1 Tax=Sorangium cellulosum TaxID=56 RepID=A0A150SB02_SORCE|nr:hypothetical protein BE17_19710 [Sorangium cellulosum]
MGAGWCPRRGNTSERGASSPRHDLDAIETETCAPLGTIPHDLDATETKACPSRHDLDATETKACPSRHDR